MDKRRKTTVIAIIAVLVLLFGQGNTLLAQENLKKLDDDKAGYMMADLVVMRPPWHCRNRRGCRCIRLIPSLFSCRWERAGG